MAELRAQTTQQPRGRPRASARWNGKQWVLDPDAAEQAAKKARGSQNYVQGPHTRYSRVAKANEAGTV